VLRSVVRTMAGAVRGHAVDGVCAYVGGPDAAGFMAHPYARERALEDGIR
jgi:hypothetical protein